jgi:hypothetical protein
MFFSVFYAIPLGFTTWNLSENELYTKMAYLVEFWLILESKLVERAPHKIFVVWILESIIKIIYPPLNFVLLYFTFPLKFGLDILWLPQSPIDIQYAQVCLKLKSLVSYLYFHVASSRGYLLTILTHFPYFRVNPLLISPLTLLIKQFILYSLLLIVHSSLHFIIYLLKYLKSL